MSKSQAAGTGRKSCPAVSKNTSVVVAGPRRVKACQGEAG